MSIEFDVTGAAETRARFRRLAERAPKIADSVVGRFAQYMRAQLKARGYPGQNRRPMRWVSERQRKYVMAAIRRGEIVVPYIRTGRLPSSYYAKKQASGQWSVGNSHPASRFIVGDGEGKGQYWMHQNRWYKMATQIKKEVKTLVQWMREAFVNG
jgi:hypothetical protein